MFDKKLPDQRRNENVDFFTRKKCTFAHIKKDFFCEKKGELMRVNAFKHVYLQKKTFLSVLKCPPFTRKSIDFFVPRLSE
jgi:hypothetical protein